MLDWLNRDDFPLFLAPMARYTDVMFRRFCKEQGADVMTTEFVQADALVRDEPRVWQKVDFTEEQRPMGVQIFGSRSESMGRSARMLAERLNPDFIDINFGCPAERVICEDAGSSMLKNLPRLEAVTAAVVAAAPDTPVTVKIRIGWDDDSIVARDVGDIVEGAGARALAVHGRTKAQGYRGGADWELIAEIARRLDIPVVGNGNVRDAEDVLRIRRETDCAGVMIGRAALGYPWIFRDIKQALARGAAPPAPGVDERWRTILAYARGILERSAFARDRSNIRWMRPKILSLTKSMPGSRTLRREIGEAETIDDLEAIAARHSAGHAASAA